jgi:hypothetical protein
MPVPSRNPWQLHRQRWLHQDLNYRLVRLIFFNFVGTTSFWYIISTPYVSLTTFIGFTLWIAFRTHLLWFSLDD